MISQMPTAEPAVTPDLIKQHGLTPEEFERIKKILGREPNFTELGIFSVMWSEHCSYKNSKKELKKLPTTGPGILVKAGEENAGVVDIGDGWAIAFKMESHNHPSAIEPFQGAATGVGGIIRDIFTMGARPEFCLNSLRFGPITANSKSEASNSKLAANRRLFNGVVSGIAHYGNCIGIPTIGGEIYFDESFEGWVIRSRRNFCSKRALSSLVMTPSPEFRTWAQQGLPARHAKPPVAQEAASRSILRKFQNASLE